MAAHRFRLPDLGATPWRNGGGRTREVVSRPEGAGFDAFDWRVSVATIAADGPFSVFAGVDRTILLLDGDGLCLRSTSPVGAVVVVHTLAEPLVPYGFRGELSLDCTLLGGESTDVNLMVRRGRGSGRLTVLGRTATVASREGLLLAVGGYVEVEGDGWVDRLPDGEGLWWDASASLEVRSAGPKAAVVAVTWDPAE